MAYSTRANVKTYLGIAPTDTSRDAVIDLLIPLVTYSVDTWCRRSLATRTETHYFDWVDSFRVWLDDWLQTVTTLTNGNGQVLVENTDFIKYPPQGPPYRYLEIKRNAGKLFLWSGTVQRAISVLGVWGQNADKQALAGHATNIWISALLTRRGFEGISTTRIEDISTAFEPPDPASPPADVVKVLKSCRWVDFRQPGDTRNQLMPGTRWTY
jgi:hypothetical protein